MRNVFLVLMLVSCLGMPLASAGDLKVLYLGDDGHHQPRARFHQLQPEMADRGIQLQYTKDLVDITAENLAKYDALMVFANIDEIPVEHGQAILDYVNNGGGFVPVHCASFCFRNMPELVSLTGAQFKSHGTGTFRTEIADPDHPVMKGYGGFTSWDETYVHHMHDETNRTVLEYRVDDSGKEPWTWVKTAGKGRVFYTAWGHDHRTWGQPGFVNLMERGILWATGNDPQAAGSYESEAEFPVPLMTEVSDDAAEFDYVDVGAKIPNYTPSRQWGVQGKPLNMMQKPLPAKDSMQHLVVPEGFHVELYAADPQLEGKPIAMAWDEQGRLWICETYDYPNELQPRNIGRDRIRICEDTDQDGVADKFTIFAEKLSIPSTLAFTNGGVLVQNGTETLFLKDTNGDDKADVRQILVSNWALGDTHGGVSNFQYGLDNWIWGMQGYNNSQPVADGEKQQRFRMGFFRMKADGSAVEFIRSTNNNTWGFGMSEEGIIFGSTANGCPSVYMPIPNRYYESVSGWTPSLTLQSMADTNDFAPVTDKVRQVDNHGGYTAGAGHALYTAREYPLEYWNRVAFVNGPTGHLVGSFVLTAKGSDFESTSPFNILASHDEWTAPIMAEIGPDGYVWVIDWYNYIVQHNPTPEGFKTGKGAAYETDLRDKKHGRIYRIVPDGAKSAGYPNLAKASPEALVEALTHPTMLIRKHAQRLLVERNKKDVVDSLLALLANEEVDEIGLNVGAIHALWTLEGLGVTNGKFTKVNAALSQALKHPSAGVRRNVVQILPASPQAAVDIVNARLPFDSHAQVRLMSLLALADHEPTAESAKLLLEVGQRPNHMNDRWIADAFTSAAANHSTLLLEQLAEAKQLTPEALNRLQIVAEHIARTESSQLIVNALTNLGEASPEVLEAVLAGVQKGTRKVEKVKLTAEMEKGFEELFNRLPAASRGTLVSLASGWGSKQIAKYSDQIFDSLLDVVADEDEKASSRIDAAKQLVAFMPQSEDVVFELLDLISPSTEFDVAAGIVETIQDSQWKEAGDELVSRIDGLTPGVRKVAVTTLLKRPELTNSLLSAFEEGSISITELALDQQLALSNHPNRRIREQAKELMSKRGASINEDRQKVIESYHAAVSHTGDAEKGLAIYEQNCAKCHVHGKIGIRIGPDLTGMAVHPKEELLTHILDPSRNVEGNFKAYSVVTTEGRVINGLLTSESKTAIELFDTQGKKQSVLREDVDQLIVSKKSVMPEGFESTISIEQMTDLLEFLTQKGKYLPIPMDRYATAISTKGLFHEGDNGADRLIFNEWGQKMFKEIPFLVTDPKGKSQPNIILMNGPWGTLPPLMPKTVEIPCHAKAKAIHLLSGVGGWSYPAVNEKSVSLIVRLRYEDGTTEDHELRNGVHFADYINRVDVPGSEFAFSVRGQQLRFLTVKPEKAATIASIEFVKGSDNTAPIIAAVTIETK